MTVNRTFSLYIASEICYAGYTITTAVIRVNKAVKILSLLTAVMIMPGLFGCGKSGQFKIETYLNEKDSMLLDYFERTVGTPEEQPYYELVLYTYSSTQARLEEYTDGGTPDELITSYLIPVEGAQEMLNAVKIAGMDKWNRRKGVAIDGKQYVCRFPDGRDGCIRVSSDNMPEDGVKAFGTVKNAMSKWLKDEYLEN